MVRTGEGHGGETLQGHRGMWTDFKQEQGIIPDLTQIIRLDAQGLFSVYSS